MKELIDNPIDGSILHTILPYNLGTWSLVPRIYK